MKKFVQLFYFYMLRVSWRTVDIFRYSAYSRNLVALFFDELEKQKPSQRSHRNKAIAIYLLIYLPSITILATYTN